MNDIGWSSVPIGTDAARWASRDGYRTVLVVMHSVVSGQRLLELSSLIESDLRVQVVYTQAPDVFNDGVCDLLAAVGAKRISWAQAIRERFDLAMTAAYGGIDLLHAPVLVVPHGAGYGKRVRHGNAVYGLDAQRLMRDGRVVPAAIALSHDLQREALARHCPQALDVAVVVGDPCYDTLVASVAMREEYRTALGVRPCQELVVLTSTWGLDSLFARHDRYVPGLLRQLDPARHRLAALIHPAVWFGHGRRQVRAWLADARSAGMLLVEPDVDWRAVVAAADAVIGDHGSTSVYAAAIGRPVLSAGSPRSRVDDSSAQARLVASAQRLIPFRPVESQMRAAAAAWEPTARAVAQAVTSRPGRAHRLLRHEMYRILGLRMPGRHRAVEPVAVPELRDRWVS